MTTMTKETLMVRQAKLGRANRMKWKLYGNENDMPLGRLAVRRVTDAQKPNLTKE